MNQTHVKTLLPIGILISAIVAMTVLSNARQEPVKEKVEDKAILVETQAIELEDVSFTVHSQGTVIPRTKTILSAQVSGRIQSVSRQFVEGGMFKQGDVLITLEHAEYITDVKAAEADLSRAQAALQEERARGKVAEQEWRSVGNSVAPELGLRKPQLAREMANVRAAEARLERARRNLERTEIRAPYDGLVRSKHVDLGQFVGMGTQLGVIYATDLAEVRLPLSDNDLAFLTLPEFGTEVGAKVTLKARIAGKEVRWPATLARSEGVVDEKSRVVYVVAQVRDPYNRASINSSSALKFGRFVRAEIAGASESGLVVLPRSYLRLDGSILVVDGDNKLRIRDVEVQRTDENNVYISAGLKPGERVTNTAIAVPIDGIQVRVAGEAPEPQNAVANKGADNASGGAGLAVSGG